MLRDRTTRRTIVLETDSLLLTYLVWLLSHDLAKWDDKRKTKLEREEVLGLACYLRDLLPPHRRLDGVELR